MSMERIVSNIAEAARPLSILILCCGLMAAVFIKDASFGIASLVATLAGALVGARSFENHTEIKAKAAASTPTTDTTTVRTVLTPDTATKTVETKSASGPATDQNGPKPSGNPGAHMG